MDLQAFRSKVSEYRRATGIPQKALAHALNLHPVALSYKLNGANNLRLTHPEIKEIIRTLAQWRAINTKAEAIELLECMSLRPSIFSQQEWASAPLSQLEIEPYLPFRAVMAASANVMVAPRPSLSY